MTKTSTRVSITAACAAVFVVFMTSETIASAPSDAANICANPVCCDEIRATDQAAAASVKAPLLALAANSHTQAESPAATDATKLIFRENPSLLTSAATILNQPAFGNNAAVRYEQSPGSLTNDLGSLEFQTTDAQSKETKPLPLQFSGQTDNATGTTDWLSARRDFKTRDDALFSGSKGTGISFAFSRSARTQLSVKAKADRESTEWRVRAAADFGQFARGGAWGGENWATREPEGFRLFIWRW